MKLYKYVVNGKTKFPTDMLRYDSCWPADKDSAFTISSRVMPHGQVRMMSIQEPTVDRWKSFQWTVGPVSTVTVAA